jgi:shikimate dehydrogenase
VTWRALAENELPAAGANALNAVIIGRTPSQGARSPRLWNAAFECLGIDAEMLPIDVDARVLPELLAALQDDESVIGGAVTMPYKAAVIPHLAGADAVASTAGAVNALVRNGSTSGTADGFVGTNTDGVAALRSIGRMLGDLEGSRILLLGAGGAGSAVAAAVAPALGRTGELMLANRSANGLEVLEARLRDASSTPITRCPTWPVASWSDAGTFDVIINTTSLGFALPVDAGDGSEDGMSWLASRFVSPISGADGYPRQSREEAALTSAAGLSGTLADAIEQTLGWLGARQQPLVFDVIYQPERTLLLSLAELAGCPTMNGSWMNLEQAVIAFSAAVDAATDRRPDDDEVRAAMRAAIED